MQYKTWIVIVAVLGAFGGCYDQPVMDELSSIPEIEVAPWPNGVVYYRIEGFDPNDDNDRFSLISLQRAMQEWSSAANITFIEKPEGGEYVVRIIKSDKTASTLGYVKNPTVYLTPLASQRQATHELGHVLGLTHEHQRPDRDMYITIHWNNILPEAIPQYTIINNSLYDEEDYPYDYRSVMHYSQSAGAVNIMSPTYSIKDTNYTEKWPTYLSQGDRNKVIDIYGVRAP